MRKSLLSFIIFQFFIFSFLPLKSQLFSVSEVNADSFPSVNVNFLTLRPDGSNYGNLIASDFEVYENGQLIPPSTYELECTNPPVSVVLVLDQSTSMGEEIEGHPGERRWDWVIDGVNSFINSINLNDSLSKVSILSFSGRSQLKCPFTGNKNALRDSLNNITVITAPTNFNPPFLDPYNGAIELLKNRPAEFRRIIVFLSDGKHNVPNEEFKDDEVIKKLRKWNIQAYTLTLLDEMNPQLSDVASLSGGRYYNIQSKIKLNQIYDIIANDAQGKDQCKLTWQSELVCDAINRFKTAKIVFKRNEQNRIREYKAPDWSLVEVNTDKSTYNLGNPDIGSYSEEEVIIEPRDYPFQIQDIKIVPDTYFEVDWGNGYGSNFDQELNVPADKPFTFNIRFTPQGKKQFRQATLILDGLPCPLEIPLIAGKSELEIVKPAKGDVINPCERTKIQWTGQNENEKVNIYYKKIGGPWRLIRSNYGGNSINWNPPMEDGEYLIRVQVSSDYSYKWAETY